MEERFKYNPGKLESYANRNGRGGIACSTRSFDWLNFNQRFSLQYIVGIRKQRNRTENRTTRISFNIVPKWGMMFFLSPSIIEERGALFRGPLFPRVITLKFNLCIIQRKREIEERRPVSCARFERRKEGGGVDVRRPINMEPNYFFAQITFSRRNFPSFEHFFFFLFFQLSKRNDLDQVIRSTIVVIIHHSFRGKDTTYISYRRRREAINGGRCLENTDQIPLSSSSSSTWSVCRRDKSKQLCQPARLFPFSQNPIDATCAG